MGLDRFANFISKSINNDGIDEINIDNNVRKIVTNHVIFDLNFLIYQEIISIENEINDIIKTILCLPFVLNNGHLLEEQLKIIFTQPHWNPYYIGTELENLFDGFNEDEIIKKFIFHITSKITSSTTRETDTTNNSNHDKTDSLSIIELVIYERIVNVLINYIEKIHHPNFIQSISIFYDGIPSFSKVIEQRRRRIKNFLESNEKKVLFKKYFDNLLTNNKNLFENLSKEYIKPSNFENLDDKTLLFDYFKWVKNRFSIDKSIGPSSNFISNLELFMNIKIQKFFPKIKIYINSAKENGESDLKIFKYIAEHELNGDYCIHTTDSDLIHQILIQQSYYKIINKDINLTVVKYLKNFNLIGYAQVIEANLLIKNILELYNSTNNIKTNNFKIIWDLCLIFYLFGNDHLPSSVEIGPELGLDFFIKKHYLALGKTNITNLKKNYISVDLKNLSLYLQKINESNKQNITKIILQRFFKINSQLINILTDKLNLNFNQLLEFMRKFIINRYLNLDDESRNSLEQDDLRLVFIKNIDQLNLESYRDYSIFELDENKTKLLKDSVNLIEENIDYYDKEFNGLILYNKPQNITTDPYQDLYNFISDKANSNLNKKFPDFYDHVDINEHLNIISKIDNNLESNDYLKKLYHLVITQFGNMKDYHTNNLTWYKHYNVPSINNLITFIANIPEDLNQTKNWLKEIKEENVEPNHYLNSINHHLMITPFISFYNLPDDIAIIVKQIKSDTIDNLWLDKIDEFNYRNIDIKHFFKVWAEALIRINLINKSNKLNGQIISMDLGFI